MNVEKNRMYKEIASRLCDLREGLGISHAALADKVGADPGLVAGYERGDREIPVSYLMDVVRVFGVSLTDLMGDGTASHPYTVFRGEEGRAVPRRHESGWASPAFGFAGNGKEPDLVKVPARDRTAVTLTTGRGHEFLSVLEGRVEMLAGDDCVVLATGDSVIFDAAVPHGLRGLDGHQAVFVRVII